jgi:hypothetical protein
LNLIFKIFLFFIPKKILLINWMLGILPFLVYFNMFFHYPKCYCHE